MEKTVKTKNKTLLIIGGSIALIGIIAIVVSKRRKQQQQQQQQEQQKGQEQEQQKGEPKKEEKGISPETKPTDVKLALQTATDLAKKGYSSEEIIQIMASEGYRRGDTF